MRSAWGDGARAPGRPHHLQPAAGRSRLCAATCTLWTPSCEVPPADLRLRRRTLSRRRLTCTAIGEIMALMRGRRDALQHAPLAGRPIKTLIGLLAATGLRISEAQGPGPQTTSNFTQGLLLVRQGKFGKDRALPLHESTPRGATRIPAPPRPPSPAPPGERALFVVPAWEPGSTSTPHLERTFRTLPATPHRDRAALCAAWRPRLHDLRHTLRGAHAAGLHTAPARTSRGALWRCCRPTWATPDLVGHILVSAGRPGAVGPRRRAALSATFREAGHDERNWLQRSRRSSLTDWCAQRQASPSNRSAPIATR